MSATASDPLILYDIPSKLPPRCWSLNMWKTRLALNFKGIPHKTEWISYPDVGPNFAKMGFEPTTKEYDGSDLWTCPSIVDPTSPNPTLVTNSTKIALYLDEAYASQGPKLFPEAGKDKILAFLDKVEHSVADHLDPLMLPLMPAVLENPRCVEYFIRTKSLRYKVNLDTWATAGSTERAECWEKLKADLDNVAAEYDKNVEGNGEYFYGTSITYADIFLTGILLWPRFTPSDRDDAGSVWEVIRPLNEGRWERLMAKLEPYVKVY